MMNDTPDSGESGGPGESGDYLARLRDLTFRLLVTQDRPAQEIMVGRLPEQWPSDLPILQDSRILGSQVPTSGEMLVILGTDLSLESAYDIYDAALHTAGWTTLQVDQPFGIREGFTANLRLQHFNYNRADKGKEEQGQGMTLRVKANGLPDGSTEVRLYLGNQESSTTNRRQSRRRFEQPLILPLLNTPGSAELTTAGSGAGERYRTSTAYVVTELDIHSLANFYTDQLVRAGWQISDVGRSGPIAWSTWLFTSAQGDGWEGTFVVAESQGSVERREGGHVEGLEEKRNYYLSINARML